MKKIGDKMTTESRQEAVLGLGVIPTPSYKLGGSEFDHNGSPNRQFT